MKQDCSAPVLEVVSRRCQTTLKTLDVESSKHVDNSCLPYILRCKNLVELGVFKTGKISSNDCQSSQTVGHKGRHEKSPN